MAGTLTVRPGLQDGVEGSYIESTTILTGKPRPLGREASPFLICNESEVL